MFRTIDPRDNLEKWYVGKSKNLYSRLRAHLGTGKLETTNLLTLNVIVLPNGSDADFFKLEATVMEQFEEMGENLANVRKSPGCK